MKIAIIGSGYVGRFIYRLLKSEHECHVYQLESTQDDKIHDYNKSVNGSYDIWGGVVAIPNNKLANEYGFSQKSVEYLYNFVKQLPNIERVYNFQEEEIKLSIKVKDEINVDKLFKSTVKTISVNDTEFYIDGISYDEIILATGSYSKPSYRVNKGKNYIQFKAPDMIHDKAIYIEKRQFNNWQAKFSEDINSFKYSIPIQLPIDDLDIRFIYNHIYLKIHSLNNIDWLYFIPRFYKYFKFITYKIFGIYNSYYFTTSDNKIGKENQDYMKAFHHDISYEVERIIKLDYITEYHSKKYTHLNPVSYRLLSIINQLLIKGIIS